ncbi:MAG: rhomboid family intramembrane serine protease [Nitrospirota bacterium]
MIPLRDINPTERFAIVTFLLIVLNIIVFVYELMLGEQGIQRFIGSFALVPNQLFSVGVVPDGSFPTAATLVTSMFLHGGILHVAGNMLYLWIFGNNVEDAMGRMRFVVFYVLCGCIAGFTHAFMNSSSPTPLIGASGAVSGVLGGYLLLYPRARIITLIIIIFYIRTIQVSALAILLFWFVLQFINALTTDGSGGGIAWYAHIAGFFSGMLLIGLFKRRDVRLWGGGRYGYS